MVSDSIYRNERVKVDFLVLIFPYIFFYSHIFSNLIFVIHHLSFVQEKGDMLSQEHHVLISHSKATQKKYKTDSFEIHYNKLFDYTYYDMESKIITCLDCFL